MANKKADDRYRESIKVLDELISAHEGRDPHGEADASLEERVALLEKQLHDAQRIILHLARASLLQGNVTRQLIDLGKVKEEVNAAEELWKIVAYAKNIGKA